MNLVKTDKSIRNKLDSELRGFILYSANHNLVKFSAFSVLNSFTKQTVVNELGKFASNLSNEYFATDFTPEKN